VKMALDLEKVDDPWFSTLCLCILCCSDTNICLSSSLSSTGQILGGCTNAEPFQYAPSSCRLLLSHHKPAAMMKGDGIILV
jgi:hypothetical protein